jgi:hypothetical protein
MSTDRSAIQQERQALRAQLRRAGWVTGGQQVRVELRPIPHESPAGLEPRWVEGTDLTDALRNAVRELGKQTPPDEPEPPGTAKE